MGSTSHRIQRQIVELRAPARPLAERMLEEVSRIHPRRLLPILDRACDEAAPGDTLWRLDRVDVDLGEIPAATFEQSFCERLETALRRTLFARIEAEEARGRAFGRSPRVSAALELFLFHARHGSLPWWADAKAPRLLEQNVRLLLDGAGEGLAGVLVELAGEPTALRRITLAYDDPLLAALCALLVPEREARALCALPASLVRLVRTGQLRAAAPTASLRGAAWSCVLQAAVRSRHGAPSAAASGTPEERLAPSCQEALAQMAATTGIPYRELLTAGMVERALARAASGTATEAEAEAQAPAANEAQTKAREANEAPTEAEPSVDAQAANEAPSNTAAGTAGGKAEVATREAGAGRRAGATRNSAAAATRRPPGAVHVPSLSGEPDHLYVHDAGLCLLWPFLPAFFARLGLLEEREFADEPSRHRAVRLLGHIATGELESEEILLPLPKILCGLDSEALLEPSDPLTERDIEAAAELLAAVIANAPHLNDMSVAFFRRSFLRRDGVLSSQDGAWLLRVARESYDVVLDGLPWAFDWARLPFMEAPLRVEWR